MWLFAREAATGWRRYYRFRRVRALLARCEGQPVIKAESALGPPNEIITGPSGRSLYVWKDPPGVPKAETLLIITLTVNPDGEITQSALEER